MTSILDFVPYGYKTRPIQENMLLDIERAWPDKDVVVLQGDVGVGKSLVLQTVAKWLESLETTSATITPRVALQDQYLESFPNTPCLKGASRYKCSEKGVSHCAERKLVEGSYCHFNCGYTTARNAAKESSNAVFNLPSYTLFDDPRDVLLIDEAHTLLERLLETHSITVWQHRHNYPAGMELFEDLMIWIDETRLKIRAKIADTYVEIGRYKESGSVIEEYQHLIDEVNTLYKEGEKLYYVLQGIRQADSNFFLEHTEELNHGVMKPLMRIRPKTMKDMYNPLLSKKVKKVILASGTINKLDLDKLGLANKRVKYLKYESPFDPADQPIVVDPVGNMGFKYQNKNLPALIARIRETRKEFIHTKGVVHMTYGMSNKLQKKLKSKWVVYHDKHDKEDKLEFFKKEAPPGTVFIACGMGMGVDLPGPDFGWQAVAKIMYPSLNDPLIAQQYKKERSWIDWVTTREFIQVCGRINRYMGDKGVTLVWDSCLGNPEKKRFGLWQQAKKGGYISKSFERRVVWK